MLSFVCFGPQLLLIKLVFRPSEFILQILKVMQYAISVSLNTTKFIVL
jgi:hypothetical protein